MASESEFVNVIAFEPHPSTFLQLKNNIRLNDRKNINIQKLALSNVNGKAKFTNLKESSVNHFTDGISEPFVEVNAVRGDDACNELNLIPSFIKIDVEGFEYEVLHGFGAILSKIKLILLEWEEFDKINKEEIINLFMENKFSGPYYFKYDERLLIKKRQINEKNVVFISDNSKKDMLRFYGIKIK